MPRRTSRGSRVAAVCAIAAFATALTACGGGNTSSTAGGSTAGGSTGATHAAGGLPPTVNVVFVGDLTGNIAYVGDQVLKGMRVAIDQVNSSGMLGESRIKLTTRDTGSDQATAQAQFSRAAKDDSVSAIFGPLLSNEAMATAPIAQREHVPDIATQSQSPGVLEAGDWVYRLTTPQMNYDNLIVNHVVAKGAKSVELVYANDNPTVTDLSTKFMPDSFSRAGVKVTNVIGIPSATTDFSSLVTRLVSDHPDGIGVMLFGSALPSLISALRTAGYDGIIFADEATGGVLKAAGNAADGVFTAMDFTRDLASKYPSSKRFVNAFEKAHPNTPVYAYSATGYDAALFLALSLKASGDASREGVLRGMQQVAGGGGFAGASGPTKFVAPDHRDLSVPRALVEWRDGAEHLMEVGDPKHTVQPVRQP